jgi:type I restriction enzyme R subunit
LLLARAVGAATRNPTRYELVERIEQLIADYNAGSVNSDEYLKRLIEMSQTLTYEEERAVREGMTEEELAIFDLLTQPDPVLNDDERQRVKASAKNLLEHLHEKLVQDWRRKIDVMSDVNSTIRRVLDEVLPEPYTVDIFQTKVQLVYDHVLSAYDDNGESAYTPRVDFTYTRNVAVEHTGDLDVNRIADDVVRRILADPAFAAQVAEQLQAPVPMSGDLARRRIRTPGSTN